MKHALCAPDMTSTAPPSDLCQLFYISRSLSTPQDVEQILSSARRRNPQRDVTGVLLLSGGHFAQLLEGPAAALHEAMAAIDADNRHTAVTRLIEENTAQRRFKDWSMAFCEAPGADDLIEQLLAGPPVTPERARREMEGILAACQPLASSG